MLDLTEARDQVSDMARNPDNRRTADPWQAVLARDPNQDGSFVFAVSSTESIAGRCLPLSRESSAPGKCSSFLPPSDQGAKPTSRPVCRPKAVGGNRQADMVKSVCRYIEQHLDEPVTLADWGPLSTGAHFICSAHSKPCWA